MLLRGSFATIRAPGQGRKYFEANPGDGQEVHQSVSGCDNASLQAFVKVCLSCIRARFSWPVGPSGESIADPI